MANHRKKNPEREDPQLIPDVMLMSADELELRLRWIGTEIKQLSTSAGVAVRLQALRYSQAQLLATRAIRQVMDMGCQSNGDEAAEE